MVVLLDLRHLCDLFQQRNAVRLVVLIVTLGQGHALGHLIGELDLSLQTDLQRPLEGLCVDEHLGGLGVLLVLQKEVRTPDEDLGVGRDVQVIGNRREHIEKLALHAQHDGLGQVPTLLVQEYCLIVHSFGFEVRCCIQHQRLLIGFEGQLHDFGLHVLVLGNHDGMTIALRDREEVDGLLRLICVLKLPRQMVGGNWVLGLLHKGPCLLHIVEEAL
mmetsp:Transcript_24204/g.41671  ORF Transcript_24204/g.41671 Transcript_24204/m.41671 type:complete len:217 (-) Transcript_24204:1597-2247(-)